MTSVKGIHGGQTDFNIHHGFVEALVRGMRSSFLSDADYHHLTQCETLEDVKLNLTESDYNDSLADSSGISPSQFQKTAIEKVGFFRFVDRPCVFLNYANNVYREI